MGSISDHKPSLVITINDILDQLMAENKQLFTSLNQLIKHLIEIHVKYKTIIDSEDTTRWDQLRKRLPDTISGHISRDVNQVDNGCDARQKGSSNESQVTQRRGRKPKVIVNQIDIKVINECKIQDKDPKKPKKTYKKRPKRKPLPTSEVNTHLDSKDMNDSKQLDNNLNDNSLVNARPEKLRQRPKLSGLALAANRLVHRCTQDGCRKTFTVASGLKDHIRRQHLGWRPTGILSCDYPDCCKKFVSLQCLQNHRLNDHMNIKPFQCQHPGCQYRASKKWQLTPHMVSHQNDRPFRCDHPDCGQTFKRNFGLKYHQLIHSTIQVTYPCPVDGCHRVFKNTSHLNRHSAQHKSVPTLRCGIDGCDQMFFTDGYLLRHKIVAHNRHYAKRDRKYPCEWPGCDHSNTRARLKIHQMIHTGDRPHACDWPDCGKRFRLIRYLNDHKNIHTNGKPYVCHWPGCSYRCANKGNIFKHIKELHKKNELIN